MIIFSASGRGFRPTAFFACAFACTLPIAAVADSRSSEAATLSLNTAISRSLDQHPRLQRYVFRARNLNAQADAAQLRPAYRLGLELENVAGTGAVSALSAAETTLALSSVIELGEKREARLALVDAYRGNFAAERRVEALDIVAEVTRRFIDVAVLQERSDVAEDAQALARAAVSAVRKRVKAGLTPGAELRRARAALAEANIEVARLQHLLRGGHMALAASWAAETADFQRVAADLFELNATVDIEALLQRLQDNPEIQAFASRQRLQEAELRLAISRNRSDLDWSVGLRHFQETGDVAWVGGVGLTLFAPQRNQSEIAASEAARAEVPLQREAALQELRVQVVELHNQYLAAAESVATLGRKVIPELRRALAETRQVYERGRYGYLELVSARRELIATRRAVIDAAATAHRARLEIERLSGEPLQTAEVNGLLEVNQ